MDKEYQKLADLEWEYWVATKIIKDEDIIKLAKGKYMKQLNKVVKAQKTASSSEKTKE